MPITYFKDWFFSKLPYYFQKNDTYIDVNNEGLLKRYLRNFGSELDEGIKPFIDNFMDLFDAMKCNVSLLPQLSFILGLPPNLNNTEATYRRVLAYAVAIYRVKGTAKSYKAIFNLLGLHIQLVEDDPIKVPLYDDSHIYDAPIIVDYDLASYCSTYSIYYNNPGNTPVDPAILALAQNAICFLQPINAKLLGLLPRLEINEVFPLNVVETTSLPAYVPPSGAFSDAFDNTNAFN